MFAIVGRFMSLTIKIIGVFVYFYNQNEYFAYLSEKLFNITIDNDDEEQKNIQQQIKDDKKPYDKNNIKLISNNNNNKSNNNIIEKIFEDSNRSNQALELSNLNYLKGLNEVKAPDELKSLTIKQDKLEKQDNLEKQEPNKLKNVEFLNALNDINTTNNINKTHKNGKNKDFRDDYNSNVNPKTTNLNKKYDILDIKTPLQSTVIANGHKLDPVTKMPRKSKMINLNNVNTAGGDIKSKEADDIIIKFSPRKSVIQNEVIINNEFDKILAYKRKKRRPVHLGKCERFAFYYLWCQFCQKARSNIKVIRFELMNAVNYELDKKLDIIEIIKHKDQFRLFKKLFLNESQCFMINQRDKQTISNKRGKIYKDEEVIKYLNQEKLKEKKEKLIDYLRKKRDEYKITSIDLILIKYLDDEIKDDIKKIEIAGIE